MAGCGRINDGNDKISGLKIKTVAAYLVKKNTATVQTDLSSIISPLSLPVQLLMFQTGFLPLT